MSSSTNFTANHFVVSLAISAWAVRYGFEPAKRAARRPFDRAEIARLKAAGKTSVEIGAMFDVSAERIDLLLSIHRRQSKSRAA